MKSIFIIWITLLFLISIIFAEVQIRLRGLNVQSRNDVSYSNRRLWELQTYNLLCNDKSVGHHANEIDWDNLLYICHHAIDAQRTNTFFETMDGKKFRFCSGNKCFPHNYDGKVWDHFIDPNWTTFWGIKIRKDDVECWAKKGKYPDTKAILKAYDANEGCQFGEYGFVNKPKDKVSKPKNSPSVKPTKQDKKASKTTAPPPTGDSRGRTKKAIIKTTHPPTQKSQDPNNTTTPLPTEKTRDPNNTTVPPQTENIRDPNNTMAPPPTENNQDPNNTTAPPHTENNQDPNNSTAPPTENNQDPNNTTAPPPTENNQDPNTTTTSPTANNED